MSESNHIITLEEAKAMTSAFQSAPEFEGKTVASDITTSAYQEVINQPGCVGIRTYFAIKESGELSIVVVGIDESGFELANGAILDRGFDWPSDDDDDDGKLELLK
jgi:hypothetical protein